MTIVEEIPTFFNKHPIVSIVAGLVVVGWTGALIGSIFSPCNNK